MFMIMMMMVMVTVVTVFMMMMMVAMMVMMVMMITNGDGNGHWYWTVMMLTRSVLLGQNHCASRSDPATIQACKLSNMLPFRKWACRNPTIHELAEGVTGGVPATCLSDLRHLPHA